MMNRQKVKEEIKDILLLYVDNEDNEDVDIYDDDILLGEEYGIDSISLVQIVVEIERRFDIQIEDEYLNMDFLASVNAITDFVWEIISK